MAPGTARPGLHRAAILTSAAAPVLHASPRAPRTRIAPAARHASKPTINAVASWRTDRAARPPRTARATCAAPKGCAAMVRAMGPARAAWRPSSEPAARFPPMEHRETEPPAPRVPLAATPASAMGPVDVSLAQPERCVATRAARHLSPAPSTATRPRSHSRPWPHPPAMVLARARRQPRLPAGPTSATRAAVSARRRARARPGTAMPWHRRHRIPPAATVVSEAPARSSPTVPPAAPVLFARAAIASAAFVVASPRATTGWRARRIPVPAPAHAATPLRPTAV
jgi:hypothetical protein